jgi:hypothetical protein
MKDEPKKSSPSKTEVPPQKVTPTPTPAKPEAPKKTTPDTIEDSGDLRSVVSKDLLPPIAKLGLKATYAQLWQNASGKKCDPNEKDSAGSPVLEKYYRNWSNAD